MRKPHHFVLPFHYPTGQVGLGVKEPDELVIGIHEDLMIAIHEKVVEDDRSHQDYVNNTNLEVDLSVCRNR